MEENGNGNTNQNMGEQIKPFTEMTARELFIVLTGGKGTRLIWSRWSTRWRRSKLHSRPGCLELDLLCTFVPAVRG